MGKKNPTPIQDLIITKDQGFIKILVSVHHIMPVGRIVEYGHEETGLFAFKLTKELENICGDYSEAYFTLLDQPGKETATDAENINLYIDVYSNQILNERQDDN